jgi:serine/threonine protein kinase
MSGIREPNCEPIPGYRLIEPLGCGGFGEVWKCEAPGGLFKAIKFVFGNLNSLDVQGARAEQELHALMRVKEVRHPFIVSMDRIEIVEGELVIVMELADKSLHDAFNECQASGLVGIPRDTLLRYLRDAAEALDHMNEKHNLQHLDVKPRNLFLVSDRVKVADFGLVKHLERTTGSGILGGVTPLYAPPETFTGKISPHSDQYSLAVVYQELLTGQRPFNGKNPRQLAQQHMTEQPELRCLPEGERPVVARALSKDPDKRFPNCLAFIRALYTAHGPSRVLTEPPGGRPKTIADTMEEINLGQLPDEEDAWKPLPEPKGDSQEEVGELGITMHQPQTGSLRPTILVGVGSFGRRALMELRCRFLDRFGDLSKVPLLRFLYIDTDGDEVRQSARGSSEVVFLPTEAYHLSLQPVAHYRKRQLEQLTEWLVREKLYSLPRNLKTQGSRALGRLAFCDHYLRLLARLRREVQQATHPDAIYQSVSQTGLALRDNTPRVCVLGAAGGGCSGLLVDLGYALRRLLYQLRHTDSSLNAYLLCGAPDDPATPRPELANIYATLTELYHFTDPVIPFTAQYSADGPRITDQGQAFDCTYLLTMPNRTPEARRDVLTHLGSFLFHELTTPLGLRLDQQRQGQPSLGHRTPFRTFGTYSVWFPRGLLLRLAARHVCRRLLEEWQAESGVATQARSGSDGTRMRGSGVRRLGQDTPEVSAVSGACAKVLADPLLRAEALVARVEQMTTTVLEGSPAEALARLLTTLDEQSQQIVAQDDPVTWARMAVKRVQEWLGPGLVQADDPRFATLQVEYRKSKLSRSLETAAAGMAEEWEQRLTEAALQLMEAPGRRVAAAEAGLREVAAQLQEEAEAQAERLLKQSERVRQAQRQLEAALEQCGGGGGGFGWFSTGRSRRLRVFLDHLAAFSRQCLAEDLAAAVQVFWTRLGGRLGDRLRDMAFCRQRLRALQEALETCDLESDGTDERPDAFSSFDKPDNSHLSPSPPPTAASFWESIRQSATTLVVLPEAEYDLEVAAGKMLAKFNSEQWSQLDQAIQDRVLTPLGGLHKVCLGSHDLVRGLLGQLLDQTAAVLGEHLPATDVAQVLLGPESGAAGGEWRVAREDRPALVPSSLAPRGPAGAASSRALAALQPGAALSEEDLDAQVQECFRRAVPLLGTGARSSGTRPAPTRGPNGQEPAGAEDHEAYLLIPASEAGKTYGDRAQRVRNRLQLVRVPGQSALLFCREQGYLSLEDLQRVLRACRSAYQEAQLLPQTSPHARCDISDWLPLDP